VAEHRVKMNEKVKREGEDEDEVMELLKLKLVGSQD
jgi:hypothetical protein